VSTGDRWGVIGTICDMSYVISVMTVFEGIWRVTRDYIGAFFCHPAFKFRPQDNVMVTDQGW
jgi:hypothetical protein